MKNLLLIAALTFGLSLGVYAQDYSKETQTKQERDFAEKAKEGVNEAGDEAAKGAHNVKEGTKEGVNEAGDAAAKGAHDVKEGAKDVKSDMKEDDSPKIETQRDADKKDKSKAGEKISNTGSDVKDGATWTWNKTKHNKVTKNVFNQPGDE